MPAAAADRAANIVLVGFMAAGKSSVARELARLLGWRRMDLDELVESRAGASIPEIFKQRGESGFRDLEHETLRDLAGRLRGGAVVATGGGVVERKENRPLLRRLGFVAWLEIGLEPTLERVRRSPKRPLAREGAPGELRARLGALLRERTPHYAALADLREDAAVLGTSDLAYGIAESFRLWIAKRGGAKS